MRVTLIPVGSSDLFGSDSPLKGAKRFQVRWASRTRGTMLLHDHIIQYRSGRGAEQLSQCSRTHINTGDLTTLGRQTQLFSMVRFDLSGKRNQNHSALRTPQAAERLCSPAPSERHSSCDVRKLLERHAIEASGGTACWAGSGGNINVRGIAARLGYSVALFFESLDVKLDCLLDIALDFLLRFSGRAAAGEIRRVG
jgi:hypothetical protein